MQKIDKEKAIKAYKVFTSDWTCRGFQYEVGKVYKHSGSVEICASGFHACRNLADCFSYYRFDPRNKVAEVLLWGDVAKEGSKMCASCIKIVKEMSWPEVLERANTGISNTGYKNSGNYNSGDYNSGKWNSGDYNSGKWNSGDYNSGYFNTPGQTKIFCFNKICKKAEIVGIDFPDFLYFDPAEWVNISAMTEEEKIAHPESDVLGGYLKQKAYKEAFRESFLAAKKRSNWHEQLAMLKAIPNFDAEIFYEISGIKPEELEEKQ